MVAYAFRMPAGIAGDINRAQQVVVRPEIIGTATPPTAYGLAVVIDATTGYLRVPTTTDVDDGYSTTRYVRDDGY